MIYLHTRNVCFDESDVCVCVCVCVLKCLCIHSFVLLVILTRLGSPKVRYKR